MSTFGVVMVAVLLVLLIVQGVNLLLRPDAKHRHVWAGLLTLTVVVLTSLTTHMLRSQVLVLVPELKAALIDADHAWEVRAFIVIYALAGGLLVQSARSKVGGRAPVALAAFSLLVGVWSACEVRGLGPAHSTVACYDLLSPVLFLWLAFCFSEWTFLVLGADDSKLRIWPGTLMTIFFSAVFASIPLTDRTRASWTWCLVLAVAGLPAIGAHLFMLRRKSFADKLTSERRLATLILVYAIAVGLGNWALELPNARTLLRERCYWLAPFAAVAPLTWVVTKLAREINREFHETTAKNVLITCVTLLAFVVLILSSFDALFWQLLPHAWDLCIHALSVLVLIELTSDGPLRDLPSLGVAVVGQGSAVRAGLVRIGGALSPLALLVKAQWTLWWSHNSPVGSLIKGVVTLFLLCFVWQLQHRHKTLVRPLDAPGLGAPGQDAAKALAHRITHYIGLLGVELSSQVLATTSASAGLTSARSDMSVVTDTDARLISGIQSDSVDVAGVKIPINLFLDPIQRGIEQLFGMRVVQGSLQQSDKTYLLSLASSNGEFWPVRQADSGNQEQLTEMAKQAAFDVVSAHEHWVPSGMTRDWGAFKLFEEAREKLASTRVPLSGWAVLSSRRDAIAQLRQAVAKDPKFSLAQYELATALKEDGEPAAAVEALEQAIAAVPNFYRAYNLLGQLLLYYDSTLPDFQTALASPAPSPMAAEARRKEAETLWHHVIGHAKARELAYDQGSAYMELCRMTITEASDFDQRRAAYYYCARALQLYSSLAANDDATGDLTPTRALLINAMGVILLGENPAPKVEVGRLWDCETWRGEELEGETWYFRPAQAYSATAEAKFKLAMHLVDDSTIACNAVGAMDAKEASAELMKLQQSRASQQARAHDLLQVARSRSSDGDTRGATRYYLDAMEAFEQAVELAPEDLGGLNDHAYAYSVWSTLRLASDPSTRRVLERIGAEAESHIRKAVRRATDDTSLAFYQSTLGEVLLARGRPHEAIEVLEDGFKHLKDVDDHVAYDEMRMDLARAYACAQLEHAAEAPPPLGDCLHAADRIRELQTRINASEQPRESRPFAFKDRRPLYERCGRALEDGTLPFTATISADAVQKCDDATFRITIHGPTGCAHLLGRDLDEWIKVGPGPKAGELSFPAPPLPTHSIYYVQHFESADGECDVEAVSDSPSLAFETDPARCNVRVEFKERHEQKQATGGVPAD